jgi:hypothetical protein
MMEGGGEWERRRDCLLTQKRDLKGGFGVILFSG